MPEDANPVSNSVIEAFILIILASVPKNKEGARQQHTAHCQRTPVLTSDSRCAPYIALEAFCGKQVVSQIQHVADVVRVVNTQAAVALDVLQEKSDLLDVVVDGGLVHRSARCGVFPGRCIAESHTNVVQFALNLGLESRKGRRCLTRGRVAAAGRTAAGIDCERVARDGRRELIHEILSEHMAGRALLSRERVYGNPAWDQRCDGAVRIRHGHLAGVDIRLHAGVRTAARRLPGSSAAVVTLSAQIESGAVRRRVDGVRRRRVGHFRKSQLEVAPFVGGRGVSGSPVGVVANHTGDGDQVLARHA